MDKYSKIIDTSSDAIFLADAETGVIVDANRKAEELTCRSLKEIIGMHQSELHPPGKVEHYMKLFREHVSVSGGVPVEVLVRRSDGSDVPVEILANVMEVEGRNVMVGNFRDITARKLVENELKKSSLLLRESQKIARLGTYVFDITAGTWSSSAIYDEIFGIESDYPRDIDGWLELVHYAECAAMHDYLTKATMTDYEPFDMEYRIVRRNDREERWVHGLGEFRFDGDGKAVEMVGVVQDITTRKLAGEVLQSAYDDLEARVEERTAKLSEEITERKRTEKEKEELQAQLIQAQKMEAVGTLAGGIAHDFNNIMTVVKTMTSMALNKAGNDLKLEQCLRPILDVSERGTNLIQQLLTFSQKKPLESEIVNLNDTIDDLLEMLSSLISEDISIEKELKSGLWNIDGDKGRIGQVITNLIVNSSDAMPCGGRVTLRTENVVLAKERDKTAQGAPEGNFVCLTVEDTGAGIEKKSIEHIFEPFYTTHSPSGTGLGLSVVYGIVQELKGWIDVTSELGKGSKFMVYLPSLMDSKEAAVEEISAVKAVDGKRRRILLVEDDKWVRKTTAMVLSESGYVVSEASDAAKAINLFRKEKGRFDLVLSDVIMPGISGLKMVRPLLDINSDIPILFFGGHVEGKAQFDQIAKDGFAYIRKPYEIYDLLQAVEKSINEKS